MIARGINAPLTSSAGRLFDAVAALAGVRDRVSFEGQAAMELEWLAAQESTARPIPNGARRRAGDARHPRHAPADSRGGRRRPRWTHAPAVIGRRFHARLADVIASVCERLRDATGIAEVVLSGGVFLNALLTEECRTGSATAFGSTVTAWCRPTTAA